VETGVAPASIRCEHGLEARATPVQQAASGNPHRPEEVAHYIPDLPPGSKRVSSNDVTVDDNGLIYLLDRHRGMHILERT